MCIESAGVTVERMGDNRKPKIPVAVPVFAKGFTVVRSDRVVKRKARRRGRSDKQKEEDTTNIRID